MISAGVHLTRQTSRRQTDTMLPAPYSSAEFGSHLEPPWQYFDNISQNMEQTREQINVLLYRLLFDSTFLACGISHNSTRPGSIHYPVCRWEEANNINMMRYSIGLWKTSYCITKAQIIKLRANITSIGLKSQKISGYRSVVAHRKPPKGKRTLT